MVIKDGEVEAEEVLSSCQSRNRGIAVYMDGEVVVFGRAVLEDVDAIAEVHDEVLLHQSEVAAQVVVQIIELSRFLVRAENRLDCSKQLLDCWNDRLRSKVIISPLWSFPSLLALLWEVILKCLF